MRTLVFLAVAAVLAAVAACQEKSVMNEGLPKPENGGQVLLEESFERDGQPSHEGWEVPLASFANEAPEDGGQWSLQLEPGWAPDEGYGKICLSDTPGQSKYRLTVWAKDVHASGRGYVSLGVLSGGEITQERRVFVNSPQWAPVTLEVTLNLQPGEEICIKLSAGMTEVATWQVRFDRVRLERM